jgi:hypothetical protein
MIATGSILAVIGMSCLMDSENNELFAIGVILSLVGMALLITGCV